MKVDTKAKGGSLSSLNMHHHLEWPPVHHRLKEDSWGHWVLEDS